MFNRAYVQQAVCSPSRTSLLTGRRPDATQVWDLQTHFRVALPNAITLPQHFKANGYHCSALSKIYHQGFEDGRSWNEPHWYPRGRSVDTDQIDWTRQIVTRHAVSVEEYSTTSTADRNNAAKLPNGKNVKRGPAFEVSPKSDDELPDGATAAEAVQRLHALKSKREPFFLAVGFLKPHLPFVAPQKYWDLYDPGHIPVPAIDRLPIPVGLDGRSLKPFLDNPAAPALKVAISQYPRNAGQTGGGPIMGYSIRDARWRGTFWRERAGSKIVARELYDELNDPAETVNLADQSEHQSVIDALAKHLPPVARAGSEPKTKSKAAKTVE